MKKIILSIILSFFFVCASHTCLFSQEQLQTAGKIEKERALREKIERAKEALTVKNETPEEIISPLEAGEKVFVKKIIIKGATIISEKEIKNLISNFENKELNLNEIQKAADSITQLYRKKGYITSRAYLPPQKINEAVIEIKIIEGITGDVEIKGNRYFKTSLLKKMIILKKDNFFDYKLLKKSLLKMNEQQDHKAKAVLVPGKAPGSTDIHIDVEERLPIHAGVSWDNYSTRYVGRDCLRTTLTHNNFLGMGDILEFQYQSAKEDNYRLLSLRYLFALNDNLKLGILTVRSKLNLGKEYEILKARGKSRLNSIYAVQNLINEENLTLNLNLGFDYKDNFNFQLEEETNRDRLRVIKIEWDMDLTDSLGRTMIINETDCGIPNILAGLRGVDERCSRDGAGGKFTKNTLNLIRLQRMPFSSALLWKNQLQFSPYILPATEQFQIGGISNVRGYPPGEVVGDKGYSMSWEWTFPIYFMSKNIKIPMSKAVLYDTLKPVFFYDWANTRLRKIQVTEQKNRTLRAAGWGLRFNPSKNFSARIDFAYPLDNTPSDDAHLHVWSEVSVNF